jgi:uncharacterized membrane protein YedE/YeeE
LSWSKGDTYRTAAAALIVALLLGLAYVLSGREGTGAQASFSLLIGTALGIIFERARFCFFCIFRDAIEDRNTTPILSVLSAIAVGSVGYAILFGQFLPDTSTEFFPPNAHIGPVSWVLALAGLVFGIGMTLSGACISGHLYRIGQGSLRAFPALLGSLIGFGLGFASWNKLYLSALASAPKTWLPHTFGYAGSLFITLAVLLALALFARRWRSTSEPISNGPSENLYSTLIIKRWPPLLSGALVGVVGTIAYLRIEPLGVTRQLSTTARTVLSDRGYLPETLEGLDVMKGCIAVISSTVTNNGWLIIGIVFASLAAALAGNRFAFQNITVKNGLTALIGGVLLGWSSMIALGCTVGVLLSGTQAFALSGWVFFATVFIGTVFSIKLKLHKI